LASSSAALAMSDEQHAKDFFKNGIENKAEAYMTDKVEGAMADLVTEFEFDITDFDEGETSYQILMLRPLSDNKEAGHATFFQGSLSSYDDVHTLNLGISRRWIMNDGKMLFGLNAFYDNEWDVGHSRASIGAEVLTSVGDIRINSYTALSDVETNDDENRDEEALDGTEMELALPLPYLPTTKLHAKSFSWSGDEVTEDEEGTTTSLVVGMPYGLMFEAGSISYDADTKEDQDYMSLTFNITRMRMQRENGAIKMVSDKAYALTDVSDRRMEKVRRNDTIVKAVTGSGFSFAQGSTPGTISITGTN